MIGVLHALSDTGNNSNFWVAKSMVFPYAEVHNESNTMVIT